MNKKVTILVACHKPAEVYSSDVYTPIHVGRAISKCTNQMRDMIGDDTGDNISALNPYYCELTAQYWAWKNLDSEYVGLCHYRRYFDTEITADNIDKIMDGADVLLVEPYFCKENVMNFLITGHTPEDLSILYLYMQQYHADIFPDFKKFFIDGRVMYPCNMFVCKKQVFDEFAKWQFGILEDLRKLLRPTGYSRCNRILGYIAEDLLGFYMVLNGYKIKTMNLVDHLGGGILQSHDKKTALKRCIKNAIRYTQLRKYFKTTFCKKYSFGVGGATLVGLKADGIVDEQGRLILKQ